MADATKCGRWTRFSRETLIAPPNLASAPPTPERPRDGWLLRLKVPKDFPRDTDSRLKEIFDYDASRPTGRTGFNVRYFECSAYEDIVDAALLKYEAPSWLKAVVFQESGCNATATSPVGAKGLWQFMPESARAYGLRVSDGEIDQRLDPVRSTDAAIRFLTDLRRDVGAWDLALAAYNMGPYGVIRRVQQVGGKATFRDLAQADLLPQETALYVPNIEAYALVLENMRSLHLGGSGKHPETTSEITVKPGTRLSLVARAAHTSTLHLKELNRAYLQEVVPEGETTAWVPDQEAHRAQVFFDTPAPDDKVDTCVPESFDWGTTVLETSRYAKQCAPKP
jgi:membrane-bound lytic murein transglycosylase D